MGSWIWILFAASSLKSVLAQNEHGFISPTEGFKPVAGAPIVVRWMEDDSAQPVTLEL